MLRLCPRFALVLLLVVLVVPAVPGRPALGSATLSAMPPHPRLYERIARGEVSLPRFLTDPAWARSVGLESPRGAPRPLQGTLNVLAVAVQFSDNAHTVTASYFDTLMFAAPAADRGSVRDYYDEVSYGTVDIVTVNMPGSLGWQTAPQTYGYYVGGANCLDAPYPNNCQKLAEDVVDAINGVVDFSNYDNDGDGYMEPIVLIHSGPGAEFTGSNDDIWSHSWGLQNPRNYDGVVVSAYVIQPEYFADVSAGTSDMTIGVFVHEMGHGFWNLPDVYDRGRDGTDSFGVGSWSLMAGGSWNGPNSGGWGNDGSSPAWPDAWCRAQMGFVTPTNIASNQTAYSIPQAYNNPAPAHTVLKLRSATLAAQEYFLLENRQQVDGSYDEYLPEGGLLIWHVDDAMNTYTLQNDYECTLEPPCGCSDSQHFLLALQQPDGLHHLEKPYPVGNGGDAGDVFPGSANRRSWTNTTTPGSGSWYTCSDTCVGVSSIGDAAPTMTANLQVTCGTPPPPTHFIYLPLVVRGFEDGGGPGPTPRPTTPGPTATRTPTLTPSPTQGTPVNISEGFESGVVPPAGWQAVQTNPNQTWKRGVIGTPYEGLYFADCEYDEALGLQDEWLLSPQVQISAGTLTFWSQGSVYWCRENYDNCDLEVWLVVGTVGGGDDVYVGLADADWPDSWVWSQSTYDLASYLPGGPVRVGFRYYGQDGAQVQLDDINLNGEALAVSPPR